MSGIVSEKLIQSWSEDYASCRERQLAALALSKSSLNAVAFSQEKANAMHPRFSVEVPANNQIASTFWQKDMSFLRLKNAELGYTLPKNFTKKAGITTARIYLQGVNLLTFSKFKLWDPELESAYGNVYPLTRNISLGLNLNF